MNEGRFSFPPPTNIWCAWNIDNPISMKPTRPGLGPGEERLAWEFNGIVQGGNVSYDLKIDDSVLEVKMLPDRNWETSEIRACAKGRRAVGNAKFELDTVVRQLAKACSMYRLAEKSLQLDEAMTEAMTYVCEFVLDRSDAILSGELPKSLLVGQTRGQTVKMSLVDVLRVVYLMLQERLKREPHKPYLVYVKPGTDLEVDLLTWLHLIEICELDANDYGATLADVFYGNFRHSAFRDPVKFMLQFLASIDPNKVFDGTDGMFIVRSNSYMYIPASDYTQRLRFTNLTQGVPKFRVV